MAESREQALDRMCDQARVLGANAVVDVRFTTSVVLTGASEMLAYGTHGCNCGGRGCVANRRLVGVVSGGSHVGLEKPFPALAVSRSDWLVYAYPVAAAGSGSGGTNKVSSTGAVESPAV